MSGSDFFQKPFNEGTSDHSLGSDFIAEERHMPVDFGNIPQSQYADQLVRVYGVLQENLKQTTDNITQNNIRVHMLATELLGRKLTEKSFDTKVGSEDIQLLDELVKKYLP